MQKGLKSQMANQMANQTVFQNPNHKLFHTAEQTIRTYKMLNPGDSVLVGVSGGQDSVALLHVLRSLAPRFDIRLGIAHLNHCLRGKDSDDDAEFVASLAKKYKMPYYVRKTNVESYQRMKKLSPEEAARDVRYDFYHQTAGKHGFDKIALAHHADDNAELVLMYLFRGSGLTGSSGIPPVREGKFIRPLIHLTKAEITDYIAENKLGYVTDSSNDDTGFLRNRIRHDLMPLLRAFYNPRISRALNRFSLIAKAEDEWIESLTDDLLKACVADEGRQEISLSIPKLENLHVAARRRIVRKAVHRIRGSLRRITYAHTEAVLKLLQKGPVHAESDLPDGIRVRRNREILVFSKIRPEKEKAGDIPPFEYEVREPGILFIAEIGAYMKFSGTDARGLPDFGEQGAEKHPSAAYFDMDKLSFPMTVRNFRHGDRFAPFGMGGTQKVKKYFANNKVPREERAKCPILLSNGKIIWLAGHRTDETVRINPLTRNILKAEFFSELSEADDS